MVEFGDEFIIESYKIPWLIWIQLLITILLIVILFFGFTVFGTDPTAVASSSTIPNAAAPIHLETPTASSTGIIKVEDPRARRDVGTSGAGATIDDCEGTSGVTISEEDDHQSGEESSIKEEPILWTIFQSPNHPCTYIGLAKRAIFKCFGLDSSSESPSNCRHEKRD